MNLSESIRLAFSNIRANKLRSILTMLGIIIGVSSVITITTIGSSLKNTISNTLSSLSGSNLVEAYVSQIYVKSEEGDYYDDYEWQESDYLTYDEGFKTSIFKNIDDLDFESIEKVIKVQGSDFTCGYVSAGSYHVSLFSIIMMFVCFAMLLFIYFSTMIKHKVIKRKGGK